MTLIDASGHQLVLTVRRYEVLSSFFSSLGLILPVSALCLTDLTSVTNTYLFLVTFSAEECLYIHPNGM